MSVETFQLAPVWDSRGGGILTHSMSVTQRLFLNYINNKTSGKKKRKNRKCQLIRDEDHISSVSLSCGAQEREARLRETLVEWHEI